MLEYIGLRISRALGGIESLRKDEGQTLVEYALILVTIAIAVTAAMVFLQGQISALFTTIGDAL